jgi:two-component system, chemotaxis family, protein-glutamate methylesterase/glutaminase
VPIPNLVAIGGSAGAIEALRLLVHHLPADLPAALVVVVHGTPEDSSLPRMLTREGQLEASAVIDGDAMVPGHIYVAAGRRHVVVEDSKLRARFGPEENRARPSVDVLFRSAAEALGDRVVGVVLSGALDDGTAGLGAIREAGGLTLVQDPQETLYSGMPTNAIRYGHPHRVLRVIDLAKTIATVTYEGWDPEQEEDSQMSSGAAPADTEPTAGAHDQDGRLSGLTCPQCAGALWERDELGLLQYVCRTGHVLGQDSMEAEQSKMVEDALFAALRALEEQAALARRLAGRFTARGDRASANRYWRRAEQRAAQAEVLRATVLEQLGEA